jgi:hypothetical protein
MRISIGVGGCRHVIFRAMKIDEHAKNDSNGKLLPELSFEFNNAYMASPFTSGMTKLCFDSREMTSVTRAQHMVKPISNEPAWSIIVTFPLRKTSELAAARQKFITINIDILLY